MFIKYKKTSFIKIFTFQDQKLFISLSFLMRQVSFFYPLVPRLQKIKIRQLDLTRELGNFGIFLFFP